MAHFVGADGGSVFVVDWVDGKMTDRSGKVTWGTSGTPNVADDSAFGYGFFGNGSSCYYADISKYVGSGGDWTFEALVRVLSPQSSNQNIFGFADSPNGGNSGGNWSSFTIGSNNTISCGQVNASTGQFSAGLWHLAIVVKSGTLHAYISGNDTGLSVGNANMAKTSKYAILGGSGKDGGKMGSGCEIVWARLSNYARYSGKYDPNSLIIQDAPPPAPERKGYIQATNPMDLTSLVRWGEFVVEGKEPEKTHRRVIFKMDDVWYKLSIDDAGKAMPEKVATQEPTEDSVLSEGNTMQELLSVKSMKAFAGHTLYPLIAMNIESGGVEAPDISMSASWWGARRWSIDGEPYLRCLHRPRGRSSRRV